MNLLQGEIAAQVLGDMLVVTLANSLPPNK